MWFFICAANQFIVSLCNRKDTKAYQEDLNGRKPSNEDRINPDDVIYFILFDKCNSGLKRGGVD